jgi:transketolase
MSSFGASGPGEELFDHFGITAGKVAELALRLLGEQQST